MNKKAISQYADDLVKVSGQSSLPIDLSLIAGLEIPPVEFIGHTFSGDFDGTLRNVKGHYVVLFNLKHGNQDTPRVRFTIGHELGHYFNDEHRKRYEDGMEHLSKISFSPTQNEEEQKANLFSASLLMPKSLFEPLVIDSLPGWDTIERLAKLANTSLISTAIRYIKLTDHPCALILSEGNQVKWFRSSEYFRPYIIKEVVSESTYANLAIQGKNPPNEWRFVSADGWLSGQGIKADSEIQEWSLKKNSYGQVLTMLFDEDGHEGWEPDEYKDQDDDVEWEPTFHKSRRKK
jgi:Zn-dependent peptidase ImmA (M78 family)